MFSQHLMYKASFSSLLIMSAWCMANSEPFWPCEHNINVSQSINLDEILGQWLIVAKMDDMSHKSELDRCDKVQFSNLNETHFIMSGHNQFSQQNMTVHIKDPTQPGRWELPDISGAAMVIDLDPNISFTMAVCYRPLNFWWMAVLVRTNILDNVDNSILEDATSSAENELNATNTEKPLYPSLKNIIKNLEERLFEHGIDLEDASVIGNSQC